MANVNIIWVLIFKFTVKSKANQMCTVVVLYGGSAGQSALILPGICRLTTILTMAGWAQLCP